MLSNYLKIAFRNLVRNKIFTVINVVGLSVGVASSLIIFLYVQEELSYDKFFPGHERLYRMVEERKYPDRLAHFTMIPPGYATVLADEIPEVEAATRLVGFPNFNTNVRYKDNIFSENYFFSADSNFFDLFPFRLIKGNRDKVLRHGTYIVLTESTAKKYFGDEEPMGKPLEIFGIKLEVNGVMEDIPANSHLRFDALTSASGIDFVRNPNFYIAGTFTYLRLRPGASPAAVEQKMPALVEKYVAGEIERDTGIAYKKYIADGNGYTFLLQPLADIHLKSQRLNEIKANGSATAVSVLIFICLLILIIAGINFVNLSTARSTERAREVGVRKVLGSLRRQLMAQFLSESLLISVLSMAIAVVVVEVSLTYFNATYNKHLFLGGNLSAIAILVFATLVLGLASGLYPAFYISALKPVQVLKGKFQRSAAGNLLRNGLVIFQFTISVILISATLVVYDQLEYLDSKSLGFEKENLVVTEHNSNRNESEALQGRLRTIPGVVSVGSGSSVPGGYYYGVLFKQPGSEGVFTPKGFNADDHYFEAMGIHVIDGRAFGPEFDDSLSVVVNQRAVKALGLTNPVGARLINNPTPTTAVTYTIVGVVEDYNFENLRLEVAPLVIMSTESSFSFQSVVLARIESSRFEPAIAQMQEIWKEMFPNEPFNYNFLDSRLARLYASEQASGSLLTTFTLIAIIVACVGLFGLTAYTANQRTKEISIRKVLGATAAGIVRLLCRDFALLVVIALAIGAPVAWYLLDQWLQTFAFRISLGVKPFLFAGVIVGIFTMITISYQAIRSALVNPAETLKEN